jgi:hypothetical protein
MVMVITEQLFPKAQRIVVDDLARSMLRLCGGFADLVQSAMRTLMQRASRRA